MDRHLGANGQTGRLVTRRVLDAGHTAVAVTRNPGGFPFTDPRLEVVGADVRDAPAVVTAVDGGDAVLSTLGVPFSMRPIDTYSAGIRNVVAAMQKTSVRGFATSGFEDPPAPSAWQLLAVIGAAT